GLFRAMHGLVFVRQEDKAVSDLASSLKVPEEKLRQRVAMLHELNPMLGHRGCRLAVTYPEILKMQVRAIVEAAIECVGEKVRAMPEIMIPLVGTVRELAMLRQIAEETVAHVKQEMGFKKRLDIKIGTMIEIPRAALTAAEVASEADFFSFGTNDLTQLTFGYSRDDVNTFLPDYIEKGILDVDPFQSLDQTGVGELVQFGFDRGRSANEGLKVGICGEHGGDPSSVDFCHRVGLDYVSCSPFRVPIARLAAAQAAIRHG
ncbi:MAG: putative PEP-binding protein, partial [Planctomycetota bacterium]